MSVQSDRSFHTSQHSIWDGISEWLSTQSKRTSSSLRWLACIIWRLSTTPWYILQGNVQGIILPQDSGQRRARMFHWQEAKKTEFQYVGVIGSLIASSVSSSLQWPGIETAFWPILALWYGSLTMILFCVIIAFYLHIMLSTFHLEQEGCDDCERLVNLLKDASSSKSQPRWITLCALQAPIMLLSYAIISYLGGLFLWVLQPVWRTHIWGSPVLVFIVFAIYATFAAAVYIFILFAIYEMCLSKDNIAVQTMQ